MASRSATVASLLVLCACSSEEAALRPPTASRALAGTSAEIDYDIVYARYPREGDGDPNDESVGLVHMPDGETPYRIEAGADLMLLHPDGSEEVLVDCKTFAEDPTGTDTCSVQDLMVSFDGAWVYYSKFVAMDPAKTAREQTAHSFIFKMRLDQPAARGIEVQLTDATTGLNPRNYNGFDTGKISGASAPEVDQIADFGVRDLGPTPAPDGRVVFTTNREAIRAPNIDGAAPPAYETSAQLWQIDDHDGTTPNRNLHLIGYGNLHHVQHPTMLEDGRLLFTNWDDAGLRSGYGSATLYTSDSHASHLNQFLEPHNSHKVVDHFTTQLSTGDVVSVGYYPFMRTWGFGPLFRIPVDIDGPDFLKGSQPDQDDYRAFSRKGMTLLTPHSSLCDCPEPTGRYSMPAAGPDDVLWFAYSPGPAASNPLGEGGFYPRLDAGIYYFAGASTQLISDPSLIVEVKNDPAYNEIWPRPVVPYERVFGIAAPPAKATGYDDLGPTERDRGLVAGQAAGIVGTSSMQNRESDAPGGDPFNASHGKISASGAWVIVGTDAGKVSNDDVWGARILVMSPPRYTEPFAPSKIENDYGLLHDSRYDEEVKGFYSHSDESWKILGEFPVRNPDGAADPSGEEDTSWLAFVPANTPFLIQGIDRRGLTVFTEQTWRHVRPGETFADCGGCHAHSIPAIPLAGKRADAADYAPWNLIQETPEAYLDDDGDAAVRTRREYGAWGVEFARDVLPLLERECKECHAAAGPAAPAGGAILSMFDTALGGYEAVARVYFALARDDQGAHTFGVTPPGPTPKYRFPQASRYVRMLQARQSLLIWKIYGERLDGRTNEELPGGDADLEDLDYSPGSCPAPLRLDEDEKRSIARWVDLGCPIDLDRSRQRYTDDMAVPLLNVELSATEAGHVRLRVGLLDTESGVDASSFAADLIYPDGSARSLAIGDFSFDPSTGVGFVDLPVLQAEVTFETPIRATLEVLDEFGNREWVNRVLSQVGPGATRDRPSGGAGAGGGGGGHQSGIAAGPGSASGDGCGCRAHHRSSAAWPSLFLLLVLAAASRRASRGA